MEDNKERRSFKKGLVLGALLVVSAFVLSGCTTAYFLPRFGKAAAPKRTRSMRRFRS